jgi:Phycobilisome degradation protein nblA
MTDFSLSIEARFAIASFNAAAEKLSHRQAIDYLKQLHEYQITKDALARFLISQPVSTYTPGLEHISTIIPRAIDCGDAG